MAANVVQLLMLPNSTPDTEPAPGNFISAAMSAARVTRVGGSILAQGDAN